MRRLRDWKWRSSLWLLLPISLAGEWLLLKQWLHYQHERRLRPSFQQAARRYHLDSELIKAVAWQESRLDPSVVGAAGEIGLMQVTDGAAYEWADSERIDTFEPEHLFDPLTNALAGTYYLAKGIKLYRDSDNPLAYALAYYNAGPSQVVRWSHDIARTNSRTFLARIDFPLTRKYIESILRRYRYYKSKK